MQRITLFTTAIYSLATVALATGFIILDSPQDDPDVRAQIEKTRAEELKPLGENYAEVIKQLWRYAQTDADRLFSAPIERPSSAVRPVFGGHAFTLPGIISKAHHGLYPMADIGFVEFYFDGDLVNNAVLYFRADEAFVPLKSVQDFAKRVEWDVKRLKEVQQWLHDHPPSTKPTEGT